MKKIALLGASGSIGSQTLDLVRSNPEKYQIETLAFKGSNFNLIKNIISEFNPKAVYIKDFKVKEELILFFPKIEFLENLKDCVLFNEISHVVVAVTGNFGLEPTIKALENNKTVVLANKETIISGGCLIKDILKRTKGKIISADSEPIAIQQCLKNENLEKIRNVYLTASGGPFWNKNIDFEKVKLEEVLCHPTWSMGKKITIDCATLMNKGFEVIEIEQLFDINYEQIKVLIHPQSAIHSMVEFIDGNILSQIAVNDMRIVLQYALNGTERKENLSNKFFDFSLINKFEFFEVDKKRFRCLDLAYDAGKKGQSYTAVLVSADELAVKAFIDGRISFIKIPEIIETLLEKHSPFNIRDIEDIKNIEKWVKKEFVIKP